MGKVADRILFILNILAATGLLISYLAPVVNPARVLLPALFGLAYPFLLIANLLLLCYWLIRLNRAVFISLLIILLGWNHLNNFLPLNFKDSDIPESASPDRIIKVLSYNVRGFDVYHWKSGLQAKYEILRFIDKQEPDILCFQEYYTSTRKGETHTEVKKLLASLPESAVYYTADHTNRNGFGIATFSRYPIIKKSRIPFNSSFNSAMYTDIVVRRDTLRVFNIHLQSIKFHKDNYDFMDTVRLKYSNEQMREIRKIGSRLKTAFTLRAEQADMISNYIKDSPYGVIVMGDFNDTPQSYAYRKIRRGLQDTFRKAGGGFGNTYSGELPSFRIDYILVSEPMIPYGFQRIKTDYSDHYPITTWLYIPD